MALYLTVEMMDYCCILFIARHIISLGQPAVISSTTILNITEHMTSDLRVEDCCLSDLINSFNYPAFIARLRKFGALGIGVP